MTIDNTSPIGDFDDDDEIAHEEYNLDVISDENDVQNLKLSLLNQYNGKKADEIKKSIDALFVEYHKLDEEMIRDAILNSINGLAEQWDLALKVNQTTTSNQIRTNFAVELPILLNEQMPAAFKIKRIDEINTEIKSLLLSREAAFQVRNEKAHPTSMEEVAIIDEIPEPKTAEDSDQNLEETPSHKEEREIVKKWKSREYQNVVETINFFYSKLGGVFVEFANIYSFIKWLFESRTRKIRLLAILKYIEYLWFSTATIPANNLTAMRSMFHNVITGVRNVYGEISQLWLEIVKEEKQHLSTEIQDDDLPNTLSNPKSKSKSNSQSTEEGKDENNNTKNKAAIKVNSVKVLGTVLITNQEDIDDPVGRIAKTTQKIISLCTEALGKYNSALLSARKIKFNLSEFDFGTPMSYSPAMDMFDQYSSIIAPTLTLEAKDFKAKWPKTYIQFDIVMSCVPNGLGLGKPLKEIFLSAAEIREITEKENIIDKKSMEESSSEIDSQSETSKNSFENSLFTETEETHSNTEEFTSYEDTNLSQTRTSERSREIDRNDKVETEYDVKAKADTGDVMDFFHWNVEVEAKANRKAAWSENKKTASKDTTSNSETLNQGWDNALSETATLASKVNTNALNNHSREVNRKREVQLQKKFSTDREEEKENRDNRNLSNRNQNAGLVYLLFSILQKYKVFVSITNPILFKKIGRDVEYIPLDQLENFMQNNIIPEYRENVKSRLYKMLENIKDVQGRSFKFIKRENQFAVRDSYADFLKGHNAALTLRDEIFCRHYSEIPGVIIDESSVAMVTDTVFPLPILTNSALTSAETARLDAEISNLKCGAEKQALINRTLSKLTKDLKSLPASQISDVLIALVVANDSELLQKIGVKINSYLAKVDTGGENLPLLPITK